MLKKDVIQQEESVHGELLDNLFLVNNVLVLSSNAGKCGPEKLRIGTLFTQCKRPHQFHSLAAFQNGKNAFDEGFSTRQRLFDKSISKRCLFCQTNRQKLRETYSFSISGKLVQVAMLVFWPGYNLLIFKEFLRIPITLLGRINVKIIIILKDMLVMAQASKEIL